MKKFVSFEKTLDKNEIESILRKHFEAELGNEVDFISARWMQDDFTYSFKDGNPSIDVTILIDDVKLRIK